MVRVIRNVEQTLLRGPHSSLEVTEVDAYDLVNTSFLQTLDIYNDDVGVACSQNSKGVITHLAFATSYQNVLCVCLTDSGPKKKTGTHANVESKQRGSRNLQRIFLHNEQKKFAFDMHKLALALFFDYGLTVTQAVDLQSSRPDNRRSVSTLIALLGDEAKVNKGAIIDAFQGETFVAGGVDNLAVRAWAVRQAALRLSSTEIQSIPLIDTSDIPSEVSLDPHVTRSPDLCGTACNMVSELREDFVAPPRNEAHMDEARRRHSLQVREWECNAAGAADTLQDTLESIAKPSTPFSFLSRIMLTEARLVDSRSTLRC